MAKNSAVLPSFAGRTVTEKQRKILTELTQYEKPVSVIDIYDGLLKKIRDNDIATILDSLIVGELPLVTRSIKRRLFAGQEVLVEVWQLSDEAKKYLDVDDHTKERHRATNVKN